MWNGIPVSSWLDMIMLVEACLDCDPEVNSDLCAMRSCGPPIHQRAKPK